MYEKYITEGIVLGKRSVGEANTLVFILTRELGLVRAKQEWRLTGVDEVSRELLGTTPAQSKRLGQVSRLLMRLVLGAEHTPELYKTGCGGVERLAHIEQKAGSVES